MFLLNWLYNFLTARNVPWNRLGKLNWAVPINKKGVVVLPQHDDIVWITDVSQLAFI